MKKTVLFFFSLLFLNLSYASHFSGGEIRYEFNGTNYDIYLSVYKICEGGANLNSSATVNCSSASLNASQNLQMTFLGFDTVNINCPNNLSRCVNPNGLIPGYITAKFRGTVSLQQASDWVVSYTSAARIASLANITNSATMYLYTEIDNSGTINSNPFIASSPTYYMAANSNTVLPIQAIDPETDNLVYDLVPPQTAAGTNATYTAGYSATSPFGTGGTATISTTNNTLTLNSPNTGTYALALRVREYRNSVLIGEYIREFTVVVLNAVGGNPTVTIPQPATNTQFTYYTCPGQNNSIVLNFTDPTSTDSVYLDVLPPNLNGWTFNATTTPGRPTATTTITWTTPSNMNPATLPHFYIRVRARDNSCPRAVSDYSVVVRTRQCLADSVWPGDANGDFTVNIYDPLAIAIASGQTGPTRTGATTNWVAQACTNWTGVFTTNNTNMKHADCNGDGTVNNSDLAAITANYNKSHPKGGLSKPTGTKDLYFDMTGVRLSLGQTVSIPIKLGSATQTITDVYGVAARILVDGLPLTSSPTVNNTNSWIDNSSSAVNYTYDISPTAIDWAIARTNQQDVSGQGVIGTLNVTVPQNAVVGTDVKFSFEDVVIINSKGIPSYDVNPVEEKSMVLYPESVNSINNSLQSVSVVPNPSGNTAILNLMLADMADVNISVADITGKIVWSAGNNYSAGKQQVTLPAEQLAGGVYMIRVAVEGQGVSVMKWIKQ